MLTASGQAANFYAVFNIATCGDHVVACSGDLRRHLQSLCRDDEENGRGLHLCCPGLHATRSWRRPSGPNTKAVFGETIANPALTVLDIEQLCAGRPRARRAADRGQHLRHAGQLPPVRVGRGHRDALHHQVHGRPRRGASAAASSTRGKFDWLAHAEKFPGLCTPDDSYHGITYAEKFGQGGAFITKATAQLMRDFGSTPVAAERLFCSTWASRACMCAWRGTARTRSPSPRFLEGHEKISWVHYCRP